MKKLLDVGDLIKTEAIPGFWVCSVVLAFQPKTEDFRPMCLIGVTNAVFEHSFTFSDLAIESLRIADDIGGWGASGRSLDVYEARITPEVEVVGHIDVSLISPEPYVLRFTRRDMPEWPLSGRLTRSIGHGSVHAWRRVHDRDRWLIDVEAAGKSHAEMLVRIRELDRAKRKARRLSQKA